ncbi:hypothetical protein [Paraburkholderia sp. EG286A]|uniref:phage tail tube protein n=1 Tax=Paraburkholderia sp. EG286A TaxID=3237014 RepID=UPI0034D314E6
MKKAISAQKTKFMLENPNAPAAATGFITSLSKSAPATAIFSDVSALREGAPVYIIGTGFASIDNRSWVVQGIDINSRAATLANSDTSREPGDFNPTAAFIMRAFTDLCVVSYQINQTAAAEINVTTLCDDEQSFLAGFSDPGTLTFDFFINATDPAYQALREAQKDGMERMLEIIYRNKAVRTVPVIVQSINESGGVDQAIQGSATLKITGPDVLTMPPGDQTLDYVLIPVVVPTSGNVPLDVTLTLNEAGGQASQFKIDWKDGSAVQTTNNHQATHAYTSAGQFRPSVVAVIAGYETAPFAAQNTVTVQRLPYGAEVRIDPSTGDAPLDVALTIDETNGPAEHFNVNWGDGSTIQQITALTAMHTYEEAGLYFPTVAPRVDGVTLTPIAAGEVSVIPAYEASVSVVPTSGSVPHDVTLTVTETEGSAGSFSVLWNDGSATETITGTTGTHTYTAAGTYTVSVIPRVAGQDRDALYSQQITVSA